MKKISPTLSEILHKGQFGRESYNLVQVLQLAKDIASGMRYLHHEFMPGFPIIHAELSPDSIGMDIDGRLKITSLGQFQQLVNHEVHRFENDDTRFRYLAPEILSGGSISEKVDVYSFSLIVWAMASNEDAFGNLMKDSHHKWVIIYDERPLMGIDWPEEFSRFLQSCWQQDSDARPSFDSICIELTEMINKNLQYKTRKMYSLTQNGSFSQLPQLKSNLANKVLLSDESILPCTITSFQPRHSNWAHHHTFISRFQRIHLVSPITAE